MRGWHRNILPWLPGFMRKFGIFFVVAIAIPPAMYLSTEVVPEGVYRAMVFAHRPADAAVRSDAGPSDRPPRTPTPEFVKGIYVTTSTAAYKKRMDQLTDLVDRTELNAMVIDVKNWRGELAFTPADGSLAPFADDNPELGDLREFTAPLREKGIYLVARIFVFQDPSLVEKRPDLAVQRAGGGVWRDWRGTAWLDPAAKEVWKYNMRVAVEAIEGGFDEVQFDYIRFPSDGPLASIRYAHYDGTVSKHEVMRQFFTYLDKELRVKRRIRTSVDLFGFTMERHDSDLSIGQRLEDAAPHFDFVSPMVYPSHYPATYMGYDNPAAYPYEVVKANIEAGVAFVEEMRAASPDPDTVATIRPWLQDFDLGADYGRERVRTQMDATVEEGGSGWLFWNAGNVYTESAFLTE